MTTESKKFSGVVLTVDDQQLRTLISAMYDKLQESNRYLNSTKVNEEPSETDLCCDWHRMVWERNHELHQSMAARVADEEALIKLLEAREK